MNKRNVELANEVPASKSQLKKLAAKKFNADRLQAIIDRDEYFKELASRPIKKTPRLLPLVLGATMSAASIGVNNDRCWDCGCVGCDGASC